MKILDLYGREVLAVMEEVRSPGALFIRVNVTDLPVGIYLIRVTAGEENAVRKLVVQ